MGGWGGGWGLFIFLGDDEAFSRITPRSEGSELCSTCMVPAEASSSHCSAEQNLLPRVLADTCSWPQRSKWQGQSFQQQLHRFWCKCLHSGYANSIRDMWTKIQKPTRGSPLCVCSFTQANLAWEGWRKHNIHRLYHVCCSYSAERQISKNPRNKCLVNDTFRWSQSTVTWLLIYGNEFWRL